MADIYVLYLEDSPVSRALSLIRRLCDPGSRSKPHVTVYGPVRHRAIPNDLADAHFSELYLENVGHWKASGRQTVFVKCNLGDKQLLHYKPDYPKSVPHITLYDSHDNDWSDCVFSLCQEIRQGGWISFGKPLSLTRKTLGKPSPEGVPTIDESALFSDLFDRGLGLDSIRDISIAERVRMLRSVIQFLNEHLKADQRNKDVRRFPLRLRPEVAQLELPIDFQKVHNHDSYNSTDMARKILGQFLTPPELALSIVVDAMRHVDHREPIRFGDPAVGSGVFYGAFREAAQSLTIDDAIGVDIDPSICEVCEGVWGARGLTVLNADFFKIDYFSKRNLVVCNPPYVRYQSIPLNSRTFYQKEINEAFGVELKNTCSLYVYFILFSFFWLEQNGIAVWLISSEICSADYAAPLRAYLATNVTLLHIHNYAPHDVQFDNVYTSSAVVIYRNSPPPANHKLTYSFGGTITQPKQKREMLQSNVAKFDRWYLEPDRFSRGLRRSGDVLFSEVFSVKRGIATGANDFFILSRDKAEEFGIPSNFLKPVLPRPRDLPAQILGGKQCFESLPVLIDCELSEEVVRKRYPKFWSYLEWGKSQGLDKRYLTSRRRPWYSQEQRASTPFYCTYIGRCGEGKSPFKFIRNKTDAVATNMYLCIEPIGSLQARISQKRISLDVVFDALNRIGLDEITQFSRVYGGGLYKNEPSDLKRVVITKVKELVG